MDVCRVWKDDIGDKDLYIWFINVGLPILFGPVLTFFVEFLFWMVRQFSGVSSIDTSTRPQQRYIVTARTALVIISYSTNLVLTEKYLQPVFNLNQLTSCMLKYFLGSLDLIFGPLIVCFIDSEIRQGILWIYKRKRTRPVTGNLR